MSLWDSNDEYGFFNHINQSIGQINLNTKFGQLIKNYSENNNIKSILEIGTWNGLGSTRCIVEGLQNRTNDDYVFYSLECNTEKSTIAKNLYINFKNVHILNEVVINSMPNNIYEIFPEILLNPNYEYWNTIDFENMKDKELFLDKKSLPEIFDLILLDGGEFTTFFEYQLLKDKCKYLMLDDINVPKCNLIVKEIENDSEKWEIIEKENERNGFLICRNKYI
jgi:hypothetical protein